MDSRYAHNLTDIRASHSRDWDSWQGLVEDDPTDAQRAAGTALAQRLAIRPDAGSTAIQEAMMAEHRQDLRTYLEHLATLNRWTVGPSAEIRRLAAVVWKHGDDAASGDLTDGLRAQQRAELTATLTDIHIERLDSDGQPYEGFNDVQYKWTPTLRGGDDWLPRHPVPDPEEARIDPALARTAAIGLDPSARDGSSGPGAGSGAGEQPGPGTVAPAAKTATARRNKPSQPIRAHE